MAVCLQKKILSSLGWLCWYPPCNAYGCIRVLHWISWACLKCISQLLLLSKLLLVLGVILQTVNLIRYCLVANSKKKGVPGVFRVAITECSVCDQARAVGSVRELPLLLSLVFSGSVGGWQVLDHACSALHVGYDWVSCLLIQIQPLSERY